MPVEVSDLIGLYRDHSDIRLDASKDTSDVRYEIARDTGAVAKDVAAGDCMLGGAIKDARHDAISATNAAAARLADEAGHNFVASQQYAFSTSRDIAALKAQTDMTFLSLGKDIQTQGSLTAAAAALESSKVAAAVALGQRDILLSIKDDGDKTRSLIETINREELNRKLVERNNELVECRTEGRHYHGLFDQSQFAAVMSQMQNFGSQLQEARQSTVNFGTMSGNAGRQSSTNNVA